MSAPSDEDWNEQMLELAQEEADTYERDYWAARGIAYPYGPQGAGK